MRVIKFFSILIISLMVTCTLSDASEVVNDTLDFETFLKRVEAYNYELQLEKLNLEIFKKKVEIDESKYEFDFNLNGRFFHSSDRDNFFGLGNEWRIENHYSYSIGLLQKRFKRGGQLDISFDNNESYVDYRSDLGSDSNFSNARLNISYKQPLVRDFIGPDYYRYTLSESRLIYETKEQRYFQFKQKLLFKSVSTYLAYSAFIKESEVNKINIDQLSSLISFVETLSLSDSNKLNLLDLKIQLNEWIDHYHELEIKIANTRYLLLVLISDSKFSNVTFDVFSRFMDSIQDNDEKKLESIFLKDNPFVKTKELDIDRRRLDLKRQKNLSLPDVDLDTSLTYSDSADATQASLNSFNSPSFRVGVTAFIPIRDKELSLLEDLKMIQLDMSKLEKNALNYSLYNEFHLKLDELNIYKKRVPTLRELVSLNEQRVTIELERLKSDLLTKSTRLDIYLDKTAPFLTAMRAYRQANIDYIRHISNYFTSYYALKYAQSNKVYW